MNQDNQEAPDQEIQELMESEGLDEDTAKQVQELMDEYGVDESDAIELIDAGL